ncbi:hypothetical protein [Celeribacter naphthalenivorans]|uniref:hypothetical protein n=1 Tax=Celeribacter naphthalenivorans TaxID=1614694 RepID=UPI001CFA7711|nr:hypothetical protein [Celeribacter naphthalenivorans]
MTYEIKFEDQGQDLLRITCDEATGEIKSAGPYHNDHYADGQHFVDVGQLTDNRMVWYIGRDGSKQCFKWPMVKLSLNGETLAAA